MAAGRYNVANQLRYLQWVSLFVLVLVILEKLFALLGLAYMLPDASSSTPVTDLQNLLLDDAIMITILLWVALGYVYSSYEVFPAFVMDSSQEASNPWAVAGVLLTLLVQLANMAFMFWALSLPIGYLESANSVSVVTSDVVRAQNTYGTHIFLIIVTEIGFFVLMILEGIVIANREVYREQNPMLVPLASQEEIQEEMERAERRRRRRAPKNGESAPAGMQSGSA